MMELADMQDLGSCAAMRWGSNPHARTNYEKPNHFLPLVEWFGFLVKWW